MTKHGDTSPCIDREEQELCEWAYDGGDADTGVAGCWTCATCGCVDINREPPNDDDEVARIVTIAMLDGYVMTRNGELCSAAGLETSEGPRQSAEPAVAAPTLAAFLYPEGETLVDINREPPNDD